MSDKNYKKNSGLPTSDIRLSTITNKGVFGILLQIFGPLGDRLLGVRKIRRMYERLRLQGLEKYEFLEKFLTKKGIRFTVKDTELEYIPKNGPVILVANHPLGGLEGIQLAWILRKARADYRIFVNIMLYYIKELADFFIFVNPMTPGSKMNFQAINESYKWLRNGHCLLVFPAGRVALFRPEKGYITDESWDQISVSLGKKVRASYVPIFVEGHSSRAFSIMCRLFFPMKLFLLVWEFFKSFSQEIKFRIGRPVDFSEIADMPAKKSNAYLRMRTYLLSGVYLSYEDSKSRYHKYHEKPAPADSAVYEPLTTRKLPDENILFEDKQILIGFGRMNDLPQTVNSITSLSRVHLDYSDEDPENGISAYDRQCRHFFLIDKKSRSIDAACRLMKYEDNGQLYSANIFNFDRNFLKSLDSGWELSRPFFRNRIPGYTEGKFLSAVLSFIKKQAPDAFLFGTVPLVFPYRIPDYLRTGRALLINALAGKERLPDKKKKPRPPSRYYPAPHIPYPFRLHYEAEEYIDRYNFNIEMTQTVLEALTGSRDPMPFLIRELYKSNARFISAGTVTGLIPALLFVLPPSAK